MKDGPDDKTPPNEVEESDLDREFFSGKSMEELREEADSDPTGPVDEDARELDRIMKPARGRARHPVMAGIVMILSLALMWMMREDFIYFFRSRTPVNVGDVVDALSQGRLKANTYVRIAGRPDLSTKATVTRRGCTLAPKSAPKSFYNFYVLRNSQDRVVVRRSLTWRQKTLQAKRPVIQAEVAGRLVRFREIKGYFRSFRQFLREMSARYPTLRNEHEISRGALERNVGKRQARLKDKNGRMVLVDVRTKVAVYVEFKDQFELSVSKAHKEELQAVEFRGGAGPARCGPDKNSRGGSVVLEKADSATGLDALGRSGPHRAADALPGPQKATKEEKPALDLVLQVPEETKVFDQATGDLIPFDQKRLVVARGGACGQKGQAAKLNIEARPFQSRKAVEAYLASFGHPFVLVEENPHLYTFVILAEPAAGNALKARQRRGSAYSIDNRTEWYHLRWGELSYHEGTFVIDPARPSHPADYEEVKVALPAPQPAAARPVPAGGRPAPGSGKARSESSSAPGPGKARPESRPAPGPGKARPESRLAPGPGKARPESRPAPGPAGTTGRRLRKVQSGGQIRIPAERVRYAEITTPRQLPEDAWVLLTGVNPSSLWYYPLLYLVLCGFLTFNVLAIRNYFRARSQAGPHTYG